MKITSVLLLVWLIIGVIAAGQRDYFTERPGDCSQFGTLLVTIVAGPLNYVGVDPKISCEAPEPSGS
jgi:hypothetical protein